MSVFVHILKFLATKNECVYILKLPTTKNEWECSDFKLLTQVPSRHNRYWVTSIEVNFFEIKFEITVIFFDITIGFFSRLKHFRGKAFRGSRIRGCSLLSRNFRRHFVKTLHKPHHIQSMAKPTLNICDVISR